GIGIPEDQLQHIFDRFYQLDNSHTRKAEGTGIGLALTKELVKLMAGEIIVKSPAPGSNAGSEFTLSLPLARVADTEESNIILLIKMDRQHSMVAASENKTVITDEHNAAQPLILLVEDNAD